MVTHCIADHFFPLKKKNNILVYKNDIFGVFRLSIGHGNLSKIHLFSLAVIKGKIINCFRL